MKKIKIQIRTFLLQLSFKYIQSQLINKPTKLTPEILLAAGWIKEKSGGMFDRTIYTIPDCKKRDRITVEFEAHYYRVRIGREECFVSVETSFEWLSLFMLLKHPAAQFEKLADLIKKEIYLS